MEDYYFQENQYIIHLIDTPGFDDTKKSDTETLAEIATWLAATYRSEIQLTGILYLQRITDNRFTGSALKNLQMFKKMCGQSCLPNVVLLTTMWGGSTEQLALQEAREQELKTEDAFWAGMIRLGAQAKRYDDTTECALSIIREMLTRPQIVLDIQRQIVDEGKDLNDTAAGQQLCEDIAVAEEKFREELRQVKEEMTEALREMDLEAAEELRRSSQYLERKLEQMERDTEKLNGDLQAQLRQHQMIVQRMSEEQNTTWALLGVAAGVLTGGLGMLAGLALSGSGAAIATGLAALPVGKMAGELGRRAIRSATQGAVQVGLAVLSEAGPQHAARAIAAAVDSKD